MPLEKEMHEHLSQQHNDDARQEQHRQLPMRGNGSQLSLASGNSSSLSLAASSSSSLSLASCPPSPGLARASPQTVSPSLARVRRTKNLLLCLQDDEEEEGEDARRERPSSR